MTDVEDDGVVAVWAAPVAQLLSGSVSHRGMGLQWRRTVVTTTGSVSMVRIYCGEEGGKESKMIDIPGGVPQVQVPSTTFCYAAVSVGCRLD